ncbi:FecR family protein [Mangrovibacterium lignilyticum]|uniref:FecR family protein n=1 Tax=Mangrovibacterium lignilyticum TaxID=2668052 RepID=UPI0013D1F7A5|nr:FecR domain-containing protein [Mangrovibacterium lignilyticum]
MKNLENIPSYILSSIAGVASEDEKKQLSQWLEMPGNAKAYEQLKQVNEISSDLTLYKSFDRRKALQQVKGAIRVNKRRRLFGHLQRIAAFLFIPLLIGSLFMLRQYFNFQEGVNNGPLVQEISSPPGTRTHFFLPDSSEVWLNASSTIKFPSAFRGNTRLVELDGEGYFKVYKNKNKPFIVKNENVAVTALGTAFNFCGYADDNSSLVTLQEGKINVQNNHTKEALIALPGEQIQFSKSDGDFTKLAVNVDDFTAWRDGRLVFNKTPLSRVVSNLGRSYNVDVELVGAGVSNYRYTATFTDESIYQVLELLKLTAPIDYSITSRESIGDGTQFSKQKIKIWKTSKNSQPM